jgi:hypothetical protein
MRQPLRSAAAVSSTRRSPGRPASSSRAPRGLRRRLDLTALDRAPQREHLLRQRRHLRVRRHGRERVLEPARDLRPALDAEGAERARELVRRRARLLAPLLLEAAGHHRRDRVLERRDALQHARARVLPQRLHGGAQLVFGRPRRALHAGHGKRGVS